MKGSPTMAAHVQPVEDFYLHKTADDGSIFDVWERGEALGDSVTPSTYNGDYRSWMQFSINCLLGLPGERTLVSIGCGNAVIEADLARRGHRVIAVDVLREAVDLARAKGLEALHADVMTWTPTITGPLVIYADGLLGHLYRAADGTLPIVPVIHSWLADRPGSSVIVSNDEARGGVPVESASGVPGFFWFSYDYLREQFSNGGFRDMHGAHYTYERPISGLRNRVIMVTRT